MKAVVIETTNKQTILLTKNSEFIKIKYKPSHKIGIEIDYVANQNVRYRKVLQGMVASILVCFLVNIGAYAYSYNTPYSYIYVDGASGTEVVLNKYDKVIKTSKKLNNKNFDEVIKQILTDGENYVITVASNDSENVRKLETKISQIAIQNENNPTIVISDIDNYQNIKNNNAQKNYNNKLLTPAPTNTPIDQSNKTIKVSEQADPTPKVVLPKNNNSTKNAENKSNIIETTNKPIPNIVNRPQKAVDVKADIVVNSNKNDTVMANDYIKPKHSSSIISDEIVKPKIINTNIEKPIENQQTNLPKTTPTPKVDDKNHTNQSQAVSPTQKPQPQKTTQTTTKHDADKATESPKNDTISPSNPLNNQSDNVHTSEPEITKPNDKDDTIKETTTETQRETQKEPPKETTTDTNSAKIEPKDNDSEVKNKVGGSEFNVFSETKTSISQEQVDKKPKEDIKNTAPSSKEHKNH